jgi:hypothetical protein
MNDVATHQSPTQIALAAKAKSKARKAKKTKGGKFQTLDQLAVMVHQIENLKTKEDAIEGIHTLLGVGGENNFKLGGYLAKVWDEGWYKTEGMSGVQAWSSFVEEQFGIRKAKADYLRNVYNTLVESGITWAQVDDLGWSKIRACYTILTKDNVTDIVEAGRDMNCREFEEYARSLKQKSGSVATPGKIVCRTFKLHSDQLETVDAAIKQMMEESGTAYPSVALEYICLEYLATGSKTKPKAA